MSHALRPQEGLKARRDTVSAGVAILLNCLILHLQESNRT